jgi:hypothetical protein
VQSGSNRGEKRSNLLGAPGVHLRRRHGSWQAVATWHPKPYQMRRRQFAASKYGLAGAVRRACRARFAGVGERLPEESAEELFEAPTRGAARRVKEQLREEDDLRGGRGAPQ